MKAKELRIGNWIIKKDGGALRQVSGLHKDLVIVVNDDVHFTLSISEFNAIQLTEQWLNDFGFKKEKTGGAGASDMWSGMKAWSFKNQWLFRGEPNCLSLVGYFNTQIKYVHQLQNLNYALTGTELEILKTVAHEKEIQ